MQKKIVYEMGENRSSLKNEPWAINEGKCARKRSYIKICVLIKLFFRDRTPKPLSHNPWPINADASRRHKKVGGSLQKRALLDYLIVLLSNLIVIIRLSDS